MGIFNKLNKYFMLTASLFLIFIFSAFSIANFFKSFYANEMELYKDKLEYRAMLQSTIVKNHLKNNMMVLESAANIFTYNENMDTKDILDLAIKLKNLTQFDRVFIADKDGKAYFSSGDIHNVAHTKYFASSINGIHEITEITDSLFEKGTQIFLEAVPIIRHNKTIGIVCGVYKLSTFSFLLHESMQAKNGYILLTSSSQEFILKSSNIDKTISENNIWEFFSNATFNKNNIREKN